eukprot:11170770-Lingulodinium_polyedra.AAC.1
MMGGASRACHCLYAAGGPFPPTARFRVAKRGPVQTVRSGRAPRRSRQFAPKVARVSGGH